MSIIEDNNPADAVDPPAPPKAIEPVAAVIVADEREIDRSFNEIVAAQEADVRPAAGIRIRRLRLGSVSRLTAGFAVVTYVAGLAAAVAFWMVMSALGIVGGVESSIAEATGIDSYNISGWFLFKVLAAVGLVALATSALASVVLAALYNRLSEMFGGVVVDAEAQPVVVSPQS